MKAVSLVVLFVLLAVPAPAHAWGFAAHKFIMDRAIALLPPEIRPLFEAHRAAAQWREALEVELLQHFYRAVGDFCPAYRDVAARHHG